MEVLQWQRQQTHAHEAGRLRGRAPGAARPSRSRSRSWAGPRPWRCRTRGPRCAGRSAPPAPGCRPAGSSPPTTGTWSPAAWTWRPAARARPGGPSPARGSPATAAWPTCSPRPPAPAPKFAAVICEDIERSGRDTFNALKLEKKLSRNGIPLFATDEPAVIEGVNATTVLVRRMKQGVAEWFRLQLKEKTWKGLVEHALDGWNIGPAPYGYLADRIPHPVPVKASQGRTKTRLALDPATRPRRGADLHLARHGQARHADHRRPAERRPGPLPRPDRERLDHPDRVRRAGEPEVHRAHGLRPDPQAQRPPRHRPASRMAVVTRAGPPRDRGPRHLGTQPSRSAPGTAPAATATA